MANGKSNAPVKTANPASDSEEEEEEEGTRGRKALTPEERVIRNSATFKAFALFCGPHGREDATAAELGFARDALKAVAGRIFADAVETGDVRMATRALKYIEKK